MAISLDNDTKKLKVTLGKYEDTFGVFVRSANTVDIKIDDTPCLGKYGVYLTWLNRYGGWYYWYFSGRKNDLIDVSERLKTKVFNVPRKSEYYYRVNGKKKEEVRTELLSEYEANLVATILESVSVEKVLNTLTPVTRTVLLDTNSLDIRKQGDKLINIELVLENTESFVNQS